MAYELILKQLLKLLEKKHVIKTIEDLTYKFSDEPRLFAYFCQKNPRYKSDYWNYDKIFSGISSTSDRQALLKCLFETLERASHHTVSNNQIKLLYYKEARKIDNNIIDLNDYRRNVTLDNRVNIVFNKKINKKPLKKIGENDLFGWVKGVNISEDKKCLIPAQLIYPDYYLLLANRKEEPLIMPKRQLINGVAGGMDNLGTLLRSIYEIIERDARTTMFIAKYIPRLINLNLVNRTPVRRLLHKYQTYHITPYVFDITNDLEIPVVMSMLVDLSGAGPIINLGVRAGLNIPEVILSSLEDAFFSRIFNRYPLSYKYNQTPLRITKPINIQIGSKLYRGNFYMKTGALKIIKYLLPMLGKIKPVDIMVMEKKKLDSSKELLFIKNKLKSKGYQIYAKEITLERFKKLGLFVYKTIIPGLQPPLPQEKTGLFFIERLQKASSFYRQLSLK